MSLTIASATIPFMPWIRVTTVTIEVTATMLPKHCHERSQLVGPDGLQRDQDGVEDLVHLLVVGRLRFRLFCCTFTSPPSESSCAPS